MESQLDKNNIDDLFCPKCFHGKLSHDIKIHDKDNLTCEKCGQNFSRIGKNTVMYLGK